VVDSGPEWVRGASDFSWPGQRASFPSIYRSSPRPLTLFSSCISFASMYSQPSYFSIARLSFRQIIKPEGPCLPRAPPVSLFFFPLDYMDVDIRCPFPPVQYAVFKFDTPPTIWFTLVLFAALRIRREKSDFYFSLDSFSPHRPPSLFWSLSPPDERCASSSRLGVFFLPAFFSYPLFLIIPWGFFLERSTRFFPLAFLECQRFSRWV